jgi:uncharacterized protein YjbJ (UPF0337 family)
MSIPALKGDWAIAKGRIIQKWAKLTDGNLHRSAGRSDEIAGQIQKRTGERCDDLADALKEAQARGPVKRLPETTQPGRKQEI